MGLSLSHLPWKQTLLPPHPARGIQGPQVEARWGSRHQGSPARQQGTARPSGTRHCPRQSHGSGGLGLPLGAPHGPRDYEPDRGAVAESRKTSWKALAWAALLGLGPVSPRSPRRCPNLASVTLSGCGHVTDDCLARLLRCCPRLRALRLENCARVTNRTLTAVAAHGRALQTLHVDFCRNVSAAGLLRLRAACPRLALRAEHSAAMLPDQAPRAPAAGPRKPPPR
ncbi:F-box and leucine-rich protein 22 isoform X1 [Microcebus murinus]|uniref:F-box and leucine-rich protein 22 isoform X1 n=1 Tax=Microcebus murinus TaxID=30608 RepID=UPI003F6B4754